MNENILLLLQYNPDWQAVWRERLERAGESCLRTWLEHQSYDQYWRHGSVCEAEWPLERSESLDVASP